MTPSALGRSAHRRHNPQVSAAPADVALHAVNDLGLGWDAAFFASSETPHMIMPECNSRTAWRPFRGRLPATGGGGPRFQPLIVVICFPAARAPA